MLENLKIAWRWVDWQGVAAIGTFLAVIVALLPILIDCRRRRIQAMNFRLRLGPKLLLLRPSLVGVAYPGVGRTGSLSVDEFRRAVREVEVMMSQSSVLEADEHDKLGATVANLVLAAPLYGSPFLSAETAKLTLELIDSTIKILEKRGFMRTDEDKLLDEKTKF